MRTVLLLFVSVYIISRIPCYGRVSNLNSRAYNRVSNDIFLYSQEWTATSELPVSRWKSSPGKGRSLLYPTVGMTSTTPSSTNDNPIVFVDEDQGATLPDPNGSSDRNDTDIPDRNIIKGPMKECPPGTKMNDRGVCRVPA
uniref:Uncharacterized protein n=1 Tax=Cuerna arida TaxID=1464854 RepID=A0A1B6GVD5_9HEMI